MSNNTFFVYGLHDLKNRNSDLEPRVWKQAVLNTTQQLAVILQQIPTIPSIPTAHSHTTPIRWKIVQRQVDQLQSMQHHLLEDINRMGLTLRRGHWPSPTTQENIAIIRAGCTPVHWR